MKNNIILTLSILLILSIGIMTACDGGDNKESATAPNDATMNEEESIPPSTQNEEVDSSNIDFNDLIVSWEVDHDTYTDFSDAIAHYNKYADTKDWKSLYCIIDANVFIAYIQDTKSFANQTWANDEDADYHGQELTLVDTMYEEGLLFCHVYVKDGSSVPGVLVIDPTNNGSTAPIFEYEADNGATYNIYDTCSPMVPYTAEAGVLSRKEYDVMQEEYFANR